MWSQPTPLLLIGITGRQENQFGFCSHICSCLTENPKLEKQDTFVEKLVTQVIKNLQVKISNIHVRYEDNVSIQAVLSYWK